MNDQLVLFLASLAATAIVILALDALFSRRRDPAWAVAAWVATLVSLAVSGVFAAARIGLAIDAASPGIPDTDYFIWITSGRTAALIGGVCAGLAFGTSVRVIRRLRSEASYAVIAALGIGPAGAILVFGFLGMPSLRQSLGINAFEAGGLKVAFESRNAGSQAPPANAVGPVGSPDGPRDPRFTEHARAMHAMIGGLKRQSEHWDSPVTWRRIRVSRPEEFLNLPYFVRESLYMSVVDDMAIGIGSAVPAAKDANPPRIVALPDPFRGQVRMLQKLAPAVRCVAYYHQIFPDRFAVKHLTTFALEALLALEAHLETVSSNQISRADNRAGAGPKPGNTLEDILETLNREFNEVARIARARLPRNLVQANQAKQDWIGHPPRAIDYTDCAPEGALQVINVAPYDVALARPPGADGKRDYTDIILPPYLAMFIARGFASVGDRETGLEVLNTWLRYYQQARNKIERVAPGSIVPKWYFDRALLEYGLIAESQAPYPTTRPQRMFLETAQETLEPDWKMNLQVDSTVRKASFVTAARPAAFQGAQIRLNALYLDFVGRWLLASTQTRSAEPGEWLTPLHALRAEGLLEAAAHEIPGEPTILREYRQIFGKLSAGLALSRWALDGARQQLLTTEEAERLRRRAYRILREILPQLRQKEVAEIAQRKAEVGNEELYRTTPLELTAHRLLVERELLDLRASAPQ